MIFDKDYNPLKNPEGAEGPSDDEEDHEGLALKRSQLIFSSISFLFGSAVFCHYKALN